MARPHIHPGKRAGYAAVPARKVPAQPVESAIFHASDCTARPSPTEVAHSTARAENRPFAPGGNLHNGRLDIFNRVQRQLRFCAWARENMQQIKLFKGIENDLAALEAEVNTWLVESGARRDPYLWQHRTAKQRRRDQQPRIIAQRVSPVRRAAGHSLSQGLRHNDQLRCLYFLEKLLSRVRATAMLAAPRFGKQLGRTSPFAYSVFYSLQESPNTDVKSTSRVWWP